MQGSAVEILQELLVALDALRKNKQVVPCHRRGVDISLFDKLPFAPFICQRLIEHVLIPLLLWQA